MTLDKVTSLADLEFKAKTNKYYRQMARQGARRCCTSVAVANGLTTHEKVMEFLHQVSIKHDLNSCRAVVQEVNHCYNKIVEDVEPSPAVEAAPTPTPTPDSDKLKAMVAELKKKASPKKRSVKTVRGASSSTRSRTPTRSTSRVSSTRRSNTNGGNT